MDLAVDQHDRLIDALERYIALLDRGTPSPRQSILDAYPDLGEELPPLLDEIDSYRVVGEGCGEVEAASAASAAIVPPEPPYVEPPPVLMRRAPLPMEDGAEPTLLGPPPVICPPEPVVIDQELAEAFEVDDGWRWHHEAPAWLVSMVVHLLLLIGLAMLSVSLPARQEPIALLALGDLPGIEGPAPLEVLDELPAVEIGVDTLEIPDAPLPDDAALAAGLNLASEAAASSELAGEIPLRAGDGGSDGAKPIFAHELGGRDAASRRKLALEGGGSEGSESAVDLALDYLVRTQNRDGGWQFDGQLHDQAMGPKPRRGSRSARYPSEFSSTGATGLALMAFLGAGYTPRQGDHAEYRQAVHRGLSFLRRSIRDNGDLTDPDSGGAIYCHGMATIALCEALAMTGDKSLKPYAQSAVDFLVDWQDPATGGWRYNRQESGDLSVTGFQVMAIKSGVLAYLRVPSSTWDGARRFLDATNPDSGGRFTYTPYGPNSPAMTAVGLLCRMYTGWDRNHPGMAEGIQSLSQMGPSRSDTYYNYYATIVLHHWGGYPWKRWNAELRDQLVSSQVRRGGQRGSWNPSDHWSQLGGRHYQTCLCCMTLEVYYRFLPLYDVNSVRSALTQHQGDPGDAESPTDAPSRITSLLQ